MTIITLLLAAAVVCCIALAVKCRRLQEKATSRQDPYNMLYKRAWFLTLRNEKLSRIKELQDANSKMIKEGRGHIDFWTASPEDAIRADKELTSMLVRCADPNKAIELLAERVPDIVYDVTEAEYFEEDADPEFRYLQDKYSFRMKQ